MAVAAVDGADPAEVRAITAMLMCPKIAPVIRIRDSFDTGETAVWKPVARASSQWPPAATPTYPLLPNNDQLWIQRRVPLYAWSKLTKGWTAASTWNWQAERDNGTFFGFFFPETCNVAAGAAGTTFKIVPVAKQLATGSTPHDNLIFSAKGGSRSGDLRRGMWLDNGVVVKFQFNAASTHGGQLNSYFWDGSQWTVAGAPVIYAATATSVSYSTGHFESQGWPGGFYAFEITFAAAETGVTSITVLETFTGVAAPGQDILEFHALPQMLSQMDLYKDMRVTAYSGLIKYTGTQAYAEGVTAQRQVKGNVNEANWFNPALGSLPYTRLISQNDSSTRSGKWAKGMYSYAKISSPKDTEKLQFFTFGDPGQDQVPGDGSLITQMSDGCIDLDNMPDYLVFYATFDYAAGSAAPSPGDSWCELWWATEYSTDSTLVEKKAPSVLAGSVRGAIEAQTSAVQHYENGIHLAGIWNTIGKVGRIASPLLGLFGRVASMFGPTGAAIGGAASAAGDIAGGIGRFQDAT